MDNKSGTAEAPGQDGNGLISKENGMPAVDGQEEDVGSHGGKSSKDPSASQQPTNDGDRTVSNGEIFSPDLSENNVVTVISKSDREKQQDNCDDDDTHSDSIETLEEDSPLDTSEDKICDSVLQQLCLSNNVEGKEGDGQNKEGDCMDQKDKASSHAGSKRMAEDTASTDSHEVITETTKPVSSAANSTPPASSAAPANSDSLTNSAPPNNSSPARPESLSLPRSLQYLERKRSASDRQEASRSAGRKEIARHQRTRSEAIDIECMKVRGDLGCGDDIMSRSLPHGTIMRKGDLIEFVADDLQEKIKRSSPMSKADSGSMGSRRSSERSIASTSSATSASTSMATSSGLSRSPSSLLTQSPDAAPPIDPAAIIELEMNARRVADSVDLMMGNIRSNLHKMSAITVGCLEAYKTSVDITCDSVDSSIKSMYALMAKCEELSKTMEPVHQIGGQIKEIKRLLDLFEAQLSEKS